MNDALQGQVSSTFLYSTSGKGTSKAFVLEFQGSQEHMELISYQMCMYLVRLTGEMLMGWVYPCKQRSSNWNMALHLDGESIFLAENQVHIGIPWSPDKIWCFQNYLTLRPILGILGEMWEASVLLCKQTSYNITHFTLAEVQVSVITIPIFGSLQNGGHISNHPLFFHQ